MQKVLTSANAESESQTAATYKVVAPHGAAAEVQKGFILPALYSASHAVSKLAKPPLILQSLDRIRDTPVHEQGASQTSLRVFQVHLLIVAQSAAAVVFYFMLVLSPTHVSVNR